LSEFMLGAKRLGVWLEYFVNHYGLGLVLYQCYLFLII
jgi:hypothetical protein